MKKILFIVPVLFLLLMFTIEAKADSIFGTGTPQITKVFPTKTTPTITNTVEPTFTNTVEVTSTRTAEPTLTNTIEPTLTNTIDPTFTNTVETTSTIEVTPTNTVEPTVTNTIDPTSTLTLTLLPSLPPPPLSTPSILPNTGSDLIKNGLMIIAVLVAFLLLAILLVSKGGNDE